MRHIHVGVKDYNVSRLMSIVEANGLTMNIDGDSWSEWGERVLYNEPMHITINFEGPIEAAINLLLDIQAAALLWPMSTLGGTVMANQDVVAVVTDADNWTTLDNGDTITYTYRELLHNR